MTTFSDKTLSQKLERTEARTNADFVEYCAALFAKIRKIGKVVIENDEHQGKQGDEQFFKRGTCVNI